MKTLKSILFLPLSRIILILALGTVAYANSFEVPFHLDDRPSITNNSIIREIANFFPGGSGYDFVPQRSLGYLTFALNYHFGGLDVTGYHVFNLVIHLLTALLVYALVSLSFRTPQLALAKSRLAPQSGTAALLAALFFVVHPVQTQAVTYTIQRLTSMSTLFYLLAIVLYAMARLDLENLKRKNRDGKAGRERGWWKSALLLAGSTVTAILAMKTKEIAFTLPFAVALYELFFFQGAWKRRSLFLLPVLLTIPIVPLGILEAAGESVGGEVGEQLRVQTDIPRLHYLFTQFRVIVTYLRLLVLPVNQNLDYDFPVFTSLFAPPVFLSFMLLAILVALAVYLYFRPDLCQLSLVSSGSLTRDPVVRLISFGMFWFFLGLSVESSFVPITDVIFEHRLYLPSVGFSLIFAVTSILAAKKTAAFFAGRVPLAVAALIIIGLAAATYQRNLIWGNSITLWEDVVRKSPQKARPWNNLGYALTTAGRVKESIPALTRAIEIDPQYADAWLNVGRSYLVMGRNAEAVGALRMAVQLNPELDNAIINLAVALIREEKPGEAALLLEQNLHRFADRAEARINLGVAYAKVGNLAAARRQLAEANRLAPQMTRPLADLINSSEALHPSQ